MSKDKTEKIMKKITLMWGGGGEHEMSKKKKNTIINEKSMIAIYIN